MDILITGCGRGIGRGIAEEALRGNGNRVIGISRSDTSFESLQAFSARVGTNATFHGMSADLSNDQYLPDLIRMMVTLNFKPRIVINNAGMLVKKPFAEMTEGDYERCFRLNFWTPFRLIQAMLPYMDKGSHILNISSMGGFQGSQKFAGLSVYSASKAAVANLTESLAVELAPLGIIVNAIAPGAVQTDMLAAAFPGFKARVEPKDAGAYIFRFAAEAGHFMNGKIIPLSVDNP